MATSLGSLLTTRSQLTASASETNLMKGRIWGYTPQNHSEFAGGGAKFFGCQITNVDSDVFEVEVEMWGAGGRGNACICCCGQGVGGNPGAYIRFTTPMTRYGWICTTGMRGCNSGTHCMCGGAGSSTCARICPGCIAGVNTYLCTCACAQAGCGGRSMCFNSGSWLCCAGGLGLCFTQGIDLDGNAVGAGCGIVCNMGNGSNGTPTAGNLSKAYYINQGNQMTGVVCCNVPDTNTAKMYVGHCNPCCWNCHRQVLYTPAMMYSTCGACFQVAHSWQDMYTYAGSPFGNMDAATNGLSRGPTLGGRPSSCWSGNKMCECYEWTGCHPFWRPGMPSPATFPCNAVRSHGFTPGHGFIRITYLGAIKV